MDGHENVSAIFLALSISSGWSFQAHFQSPECLLQLLRPSVQTYETQEKIDFI